MLETKGLSGAETLLHVLGSMGVDRIFASPGSEWSPLWEELAKAKAKGEGVPLYVSSRHEETAIGMASGYAKSTGKLPAVIIHTTVGALHASMGLRAAFHEQVPMVVMAGESIAFGEDKGPDPGGQWLRHLADVGGPARLVQPTVKWSFGVNNSAILPSTFQRACQIALSAPQGPVFLSVPMEFLFEKMNTNPPPTTAIPVAPTADTEQISELARLLLIAKNPIIISEEGAKNAAIAERLVELAELLGIPVVETRSAGYINFPRSHPLHGGFDPNEYIPEADLIFLIGAVSPWHPASAGPGENTKVAVLDDNPLRTNIPYWGYQMDLCLAGEVGSSLVNLLKELKNQMSADDKKLSDRAEKWRIRFQKRKVDWKIEAESQNKSKPIDTRWVIHELNEVLPDNAMIVEETITHRQAIMHHIDRLQLGSFFTGVAGGLGTGLGTALGIKYAAPHRPVVALIGDGSFNYNPGLAVFGTIQEHGIPILIVLLNNHGYLSMKSGVPKYYPEGWATRTKTFVGTSIAPTPDYAAVARAFDCFGETVTEPSEVRPAFERGFKAISSGQGALIDFRLQPVN